jgi:uncharacterized protein
MSQPLPAFRYHPDPLATGAVEASDETCASCNQARGYIYRAHSGDVCPWCIASGEADETVGFESVAPDYVGKFAWEMVLHHSGYSRWPAVPEAVAREVAHRTPGFPTYQDTLWWTHCDDAGAFIGVVGDLPAETFADESARDFVDEIKRCEDLTDEDWEWHVSTPDAEHHKTIYVFRCLHCGKLGGYADGA